MAVRVGWHLSIRLQGRLAGLFSVHGHCKSRRSQVSSRRFALFLLGRRLCVELLGPNFKFPAAALELSGACAHLRGHVGGVVGYEVIPNYGSSLRVSGY